MIRRDELIEAIAGDLGMSVLARQTPEKRTWAATVALETIERTLKLRLVRTEQGFNICEQGDPRP